jgi:hypothetical protein
MNMIDALQRLKDAGLIVAARLAHQGHLPSDPRCGIGRCSLTRNQVFGSYPSRPKDLDRLVLVFSWPGDHGLFAVLHHQVVQRRYDQPL